MHIYFKAPLIDNDSYHAHLAEHIISEILWNIDYFNYRFDLKAKTYPWYCIFDFPSRVSLDEIFIILEELKNKKIDSIIPLEQEVIKKELEDPEYNFRIYEGAINFSSTNKYLLNTNYKNITVNDFKEYYIGYISKENIIITDDEYSPLWEGFKEPLHEWKQPEVKKEPFSFEDDKYINLKFSNITADFIWKLHCIFEILDAHNTQMQRINNREYFYLTPYFYFFQPEKKIIFTIPDTDYTIDETFFNKWKEFVINAIKSWYYKENLKVIFPYFFWVKTEEKSIISEVESFRFDEFMKIIS